MAKARVTISIDEELAASVLELVESGEGESLSSWVGEAIRQRQDREARLRALQAVVADYEEAFGEITEEEMAAQQRADAGTASERSPAEAALERQRALADEVIPRRRASRLDRAADDEREPTVPDSSPSR